MRVRRVGDAPRPGTPGPGTDAASAVVRAVAVRPLLRCHPAAPGAGLSPGAGPTWLGECHNGGRRLGLRHRPLRLLRRMAPRLLQRLHGHPDRVANAGLAPPGCGPPAGHRPRGSRRVKRWYGIRRLYDASFRDRVLLMLLLGPGAYYPIFSLVPRPTLPPETPR